jgi:hypothetical protein
MGSLKNFARSILLISAIAPLILTPSIAGIKAAKPMGEIDRAKIAIGIDKKLINKFKVNGISLGASKNSIAKAFGKPIKVKKYSDIGCRSDRTRFETIYYQGAEFTLVNGILEIAHISSPKYKTESGVRVGDKITAIGSQYSKYGKVSKFYGGGLEIRPLIFQSQNGLIKKIMLAEADDLC